MNLSLSLSAMFIFSTVIFF